MAARSWRCVLSLALVVVAGMMVATQIMLTRNQATTSDVLSAARHWATGDGGYTEGEVTERRRGAAGAPRPLMQAPIIPPRPAHPGTRACAWLWVKSQAHQLMWTTNLHVQLQRTYHIHLQLCCTQTMVVMEVTMTTLRHAHSKMRRSV